MQKMIIMRGLPGSGKSTLTEELAATLDNAAICSTDEYFSLYGNYVFIPELLTSYHEQNRQRVATLLHLGHTVIVDNTNLRLSEMKPYVEMAKKYNSSLPIEIVHTNTPWANDPIECAKRCTKNIPEALVQKMWKIYQPTNNADNLLSLIQNTPFDKPSLPTGLQKDAKTLSALFQANHWLPIHAKSFFTTKEDTNTIFNTLTTLTDPKFPLVHPLFAYVDSRLKYPFYLPKDVALSLNQNTQSATPLQSIYNNAPNVNIDSSILDSFLAPSHQLFLLSL